MKDLKNCKMKAFNDNNYDQIENFIEYESFIENSYFFQVMRFANYLIDFMESSASPAEFNKSFFSNMTEQLVATQKILSDFTPGNAHMTKKART